MSSISEWSKFSWSCHPHCIWPLSSFDLNHQGHYCDGNWPVAYIRSKTSKRSPSSTQLPRLNENWLLHAVTCNAFKTSSRLMAAFLKGLFYIEHLCFSYVLNYLGSRPSSRPALLNKIFLLVSITWHQDCFNAEICLQLPEILILEAKDSFIEFFFFSWIFFFTNLFSVIWCTLHIS